MTDRKPKSAFADRFDETWSVVRRAQVRQGVCRAVFVVAFGILLLAATDYLWELSWLPRAVGLGAVGGIAVIAAVVGIAAPLLWWSRPRTAVEIEQRFPELGQRVRTVVQFSGREEKAVVSEGIMPGLLGALEEETDVRTQPLDLRDVVSWWKLKLAALMAVVPVVLLLLGLVIGWETRMAVCRAMLDDRSYTTLAVTPGDVLVDKGNDVSLSLELTGRVSRQVVLRSRPADGGSAWQEQKLSAEDVETSGRRLVQYKSTLENLEGPVEYHFVAGRARSDVHRIRVRLPLAITKFEAVVNPPAYTGLEPKTVEGGDLDVIQRSRVKFQIQFSRPTVKASLVFSDPAHGVEDGEAQAEPTRVPLTLENGLFVAEMQFQDNKTYSIVADTQEGQSLPKTRYRVGVRKDQPPRVSFHDPDEQLEVHSIAEVLMRIRAADDFGLSKTGIVFQVNNREEITLASADFPVLTGKSAGEDLSLTLRTALEEKLALENHELTPTDSVIYYAFAEDNFPDEPRRTETDLRFIDIRSFKRIYKVGGT